MRTTIPTPVRLCVLALSLSLGAAAPAIAQTGGLAAPEPAATTTTKQGSSTASGGLKAGRHALQNRRQRAKGTLGTAAATPVELQLAGADGAWATVATTTTTANGAFSVIWRPRKSGRFSLRAIRGGSGTAAREASVTPTADITVYATSIATEYGPTTKREPPEPTACGPKVTTTTLGVAHKTLPCGTLVELFYDGRTITVAVIDRGPYANNATWDLTRATARKLKFNGLDRVGAVISGRIDLG